MGLLQLAEAFPTDPAEILRGLIAAQTACLHEARAGRGTGRSAYWARHHPAIKAVLPKAATLLQPQERQAIYATLLRLGQFPDVTGGELPLLVAGYRDTLPDFALLQGMVAPRLQMLQVFGFDEHGAIEGGLPTDLKMLKARMAPVTQAFKFSNLPGQRAKLPGFAALADHAPRLLSVLRHAGYRHDQRQDAEAFYAAADLLFWGFVLIALLAPVTRDTVIADLVGPQYAIPKRVEQEHILQTTLDQLPSFGQGPMAIALARRCQDRLAGSAAARWAEALGLPFAGRDWEVNIAVPAADNSGSGLLMPNLKLTISPDPLSSWRIALWSDRTLVYSDHEGQSPAGDRAIPGLAEGMLASFPDWVAGLAAHGHPHDLSRAVVQCGKNRAAVVTVRRWLETGGI